MVRKRKAATTLTPDYSERVVDTILFLVLPAFSLLVGAIVLAVAFLSWSHKSPHSFCLATATEDSCVHRPGKSFGKKTYRTPDKLLEYFGSIPERVQQKWRVWVMDKEESSTVELTVEEFYVWIDTVWHPLLAEANTS